MTKREREQRAALVMVEIWFITWQAHYDSTLCPPHVYDYMVG